MEHVLLCVSIRLFQMILQCICFHGTSSGGERQRATAIHGLSAQKSQVAITLEFKRSREIFKGEQEGGGSEANEEGSVVVHCII